MTHVACVKFWDAHQHDAKTQTTGDVLFLYSTAVSSSLFESPISGEFWDDILHKMVNSDSFGCLLAWFLTFSFNTFDPQNLKGGVQNLIYMIFVYAWEFQNQCVRQWQML